MGLSEVAAQSIGIPAPSASFLIALFSGELMPNPPPATDMTKACMARVAQQTSNAHFSMVLLKKQDLYIKKPCSTICTQTVWCTHYKDDLASE